MRRRVSWMGRAVVVVASVGLLEVAVLPAASAAQAPPVAGLAAELPALASTPPVVDPVVIAMWDHGPPP
ncbi:MAG TPA: hypothetical protein VIQ02_20445 [Jiangellaceae bacterium]